MSKAVRFLKGWFIYGAKAATGYASKRRRIVMLHFGRCGSTVCGEMLAQVPGVQWDGEIYEEARKGVLPGQEFVRNPRRLLTLRLQSMRKPVYGFELKAHPHEHLRPSLLDMSIEECLGWLQEQRFEMIFLTRKSSLRQIVSNEISQRSGVWHVSNRDGASPPNPGSVEINLDAVHFGDTSLPLLEALDRYDLYRKEILRLLPAGSLHINFEEDIERDPRQAFAKIVDHLGLKADQPEVRVRRTNGRPLSELVTNWTEVTAALRPTRFAWMLEDGFRHDGPGAGSQ